jgi:flagellin
MSLGVLNNLSAVYAENNLNNTQSSLSKTLQQLSSGSKINSGSDDAAGLSLVDGLQANSMALTQSQTNAQEGAGLLQVADGALSQVTNLLNRAVTLATEASNGTLTGAQYNAADQEYQSILSEVSNIGSTTTYNQQAVFGNTFNIYTSDSSSTGASIDSLNISSLSQSAVGDTAGAMAYSNGKSVFIDLTVGGNGNNANSGDTLGAATDTSQLVVHYLDASGATQATTISAGSGTAYANTVSGMISAINNSGLGISASFGTAAQAGSADTAANTGIIITGSVGTVAPGSGSNHVEIGMGGAGDLVGDKQTGQLTGAGPVTATTATETAGTKGTAQISYTAGAGQSLSGNLKTATAAASALTNLNAAISDVAAQDGYVGAQINTLNAVGQVLSTQSENVQAAQNAVQATDYASAASNMSKYQILSQTGISALAQANSMQQMVTKLLQ